MFSINSRKHLKSEIPYLIIRGKNRTLDFMTWYGRNTRTLLGLEIDANTSLGPRCASVESCVRKTGASRRHMSPLSGPRSASKTRSSILRLRVPSCLILPRFNFMSGTVRQLCGVCVCVCHPILGAHSVRLGTSVLVMLLCGSGVQKKT